MLRSCLPILLILSGCASVRSASFTWPDGAPRQAGQLSGKQQIGEWTYTDRQGRPEARGAFRAGIPDGTWTWWHSNGAVSRKGTFAKGLRVGTWSLYHDNGRLAEVGDYDQDRQQGPWRTYHRDGQPAVESWFAHGLRQGPWTAASASGAVVAQGLYQDGLRVGPWRDGAAPVASLGAAPGRSESQHPYADGVTVWQSRRGTIMDSAVVTRADGAIAVAAVPEADGVVRTWVRKDAEAWFATATAAATTVEVALSAVARDLLVPMPATASPVVAPVVSAGPVASGSDTPSIAQLTPPIVDAPAPPPIMPGFWTPQEETRIPVVLAKFAGTEAPVRIVDYDIPAARPAERQEQRLIGTRLPRTRFLSADGKVLDTDAINRSGKHVVLVIMRGFSGQICIYCAAQTATLADALPRFRARDAEVVVVYPGPAETVPSFIKAVQTLRADPPPMPIGLDVDLGLVRGLAVNGMLAQPTALVVDKQGQIRFAYVGRDMADRPSVEDLLAALPAVMAP